MTSIQHRFRISVVVWPTFHLHMLHFSNGEILTKDNIVKT